MAVSLGRSEARRVSGRTDGDGLVAQLSSSAWLSCGFVG